MGESEQHEADRPTDPPEADEAQTSGKLAANGRFECERVLGTGAMGTVYLARDRETGEHLALKRLFGVDAKAALRIKREFRSLAGASHPNLVKMYELGKDAEGWFLTMEFVDGESLGDHIGPSSLATVSVDSTLCQLGDFESRLEERILPTFGQLAEAIHALHRARMLHRDLKPSNVMVTRDGRVVVLDFGLVRNLEADTAAMTIEGGITGTPAYMAPEQAQGRALTEAADWYAFGIMLYEALAGVLPFEGSTFQVMQHKLERTPDSARSHNRDIPEELDALCMRLLAREPTERPRGGTVLGYFSQLLGPRAAHGRQASKPVPGPVVSMLPFFGRDGERKRLWRAMEEVQHGRPAVVHLLGASGSGKSALAGRFLDEVEQQLSTRPGQALVLRSRCYEREAMPFKALDGVMDAMCRHLSTRDEYEVSNALPMDIAPLAQLFPVLGRLRPVQHLLSASSNDGPTVQGRKRAESALREMLGRIAARSPLVIWIDDLQWGDLDSAAILGEWLQGRLDGSVLLVLSYRSDEVATSDCLRALSRRTESGSPLHSTRIELGPLSPVDLGALCEQQLAQVDGDHSALAMRLAQEADGSPFLATQLAALACAKLRRGHQDLDLLSIADLVAQAMDMLSLDARRLLQTLSVAARPLPPRIALRAAGITRRGREALHALTRLQLARSRDLGGERRVELYHDRVREEVYALLDEPERKRAYADLLDAVEYTPHADPDWLHVLALGAGEPIAALRYGLDAAARASASLAFEQAAALYARCIELADPGSSSLNQLYQRLAIAEGACGRGVQAADAYLRAAELSAGEQALSMLRGATSHLFRSGRFEAGEEMLTRVLAAMDLHVPSSRRGLLATVAWERTRIAIRGLGYTTRREDQIPAATLARIDACNALRNETLSIDPLRAALFLGWQLRWALDAGEPMRILQALCGVGYLRSTRGTGDAAKQTEDLITRTEALANQIGTPEARAQHCATAAIVNWMLGRPDRVPPLAEEAARLHRAHRSSDLDVTYYIRLAVTAAHAGVLYELGDFPAFIRVLEPALIEAREADNRSALLYLALPETLYDELAGRSVEARERVEEQRAQLPKNGFGIYHTLHMASVCVAARLSGDYAWGMAYLEQDWPRYERSLVRRSAMMSYVAERYRLQLLLNAHLTARDEPALRRLLKREIPALERHPIMRRADAPAQVERARVLFGLGERQRATALLQQGGHLVYRGERACTDHAHGLMLGGEAGRVMCEQALAELDACGVMEKQPYLYAHHPELMASPIPTCAAEDERKDC